MKINLEKVRSLKFKRLYLIYIFGFLANLRPSDPYIYELLTANDFKNLSEEQINQDVYPIATYSLAIHLIFMLFIIDLCNYNLFIWIYALAGIVWKVLTLWTTSLFDLQVAQAIYGTFSATELVFFIYIYAHEDVTKFKQATCYVRIATLLGKMVADFIAQIGVSVDGLSFQQLEYISFAFIIISFFVALALPFAENAYLNKSKDNDEMVISKIASNFVNSYSDKYIAKWTLWSAFTFCSYIQVSTYIQPLWHKQFHNETLLNGLIEGLVSFFSVIAIYLGTLVNIQWRINGDLILTCVTLMQGFMLLLGSQFDDIFATLSFYTVYSVFYYFSVTVLSAELAKTLKKGCFGLVFGLIGVLGAILHAVLVGFVNDDIGFELKAKDQFLAYGAFHLGVAVLFIVIGLASWWAKRTYW